MELARAQKISQFVKRDEEYKGFQLHIPMDVMTGGVKVESITMFISSESCYSDGDLAVNWNIDGLQNTGGGDMGSLVMRGNNDEVGSKMGHFYWENGFDKELQDKLIECGFSEESATDVSGSEWGMQDEGRASYDAYKLADEIRKAMLAIA